MFTCTNRCFETDQEVDHKNGNGLDNRRFNLRPAEHWQNCHNRPEGKNNSTGFKGVFQNGSGFMAQIRVRGKVKHLGTFNTAEEAALAYNTAARTEVGEFAHLNKGAAPAVSERVYPTRARRKQNGALGLKGVQVVEGAFVARIYAGGKKIYIGSFKDARAAAEAYNAEAIKRFGDNAVLNKL